MKEPGIMVLADDGGAKLAGLIDADNAQPTIIDGLLAEIAKWAVRAAALTAFIGEHANVRRDRSSQTVSVRGS